MKGKEMDRKESPEEVSCHLWDVDLKLLIPAKTVVQVLSDYCSIHVANGEVLSIDEIAGLGHVLEMLADKIDLIGETLGEIQGEIFRLEPVEG